MSEPSHPPSDGPPSAPLPQWMTSPASTASTPSSPSLSALPSVPPASAAPSADGSSQHGGRRPGEPAGSLSQVPLSVVEKLLSNHPALQSCARIDLTEIVTAVRPYECGLGAPLLEAGVTPTGLGLLVTGSAHAMLPGSDAGVEAMLAPDLFGESVAFGGEPSRYNVVAGSACRVLWLPLEVMHYLLERTSGLAAVFAQRHARRLEALAGGSRPTSSTPSMPAALAPSGSASGAGQSPAKQGTSSTPSFPSMPAFGSAAATKPSPSAPATPGAHGQNPRGATSSTPAFPALPALGAHSPAQESASRAGADPFDDPPSGRGGLSVAYGPLAELGLSPTVTPPPPPPPQAPISLPLAGASPAGTIGVATVSPTTPAPPQGFAAGGAVRPLSVTPGSGVPFPGALPPPWGPGSPLPRPSADAIPLESLAPTATAPTPTAREAQTSTMPWASTPPITLDVLATSPTSESAPPSREQPPVYREAAAAREVPHARHDPRHEVAAPPPKRPTAPVAVEADVLRFVEVGDYDLGPTVLSLIPAKLIRHHRMLPLRVTGTRLTVGLVAPRNAAALADLARTVQGMFDVEIVAISADDFAQAIVRHRLEDARLSSASDSKPRLSINPDTLVFEQIELERDLQSTPKNLGDDAVRLVNRVIATALEREASDIHLEPVSAGLRVRFRVHGTLHDWNEGVPPQIARSVTARVKIMAGLDIAERRRPQDGRIGVRVGRRDIDLRVSCLPAARGEKIVMRVLDGAMATRPLGQVFLDQRVLQMVRKALNRPYGGIIVGGATGAGKTSTLYAMLNERRQTRPDTHVTMVEDPIEYRLEGVTQVQVDPAADLGFSSVLRSMLRQDPDVIVVGEMRDSETARTALEAAMTGHVLLTSVHANNALSVVQRLEELECRRPLISLSLALILVQRLVRRLCSACNKLAEAPPTLFDALVRRNVLEPAANRALPSPFGCDACGRTGFVGRIAVFEAMQLNDDIRHLLASGAPLAEVERVAIDGGAYVPFSSYARQLLREQMISAGEALLTVTE